MKIRHLQLLVLALSCTFSFACSGGHSHTHGQGHDHHHHSSASPSPSASTTAHHHKHTAPHGGALVAFGDEFAHLEILLDKEKGELTAYILDGEAENPVRLPGPDLELKLDNETTVTLKPVADELTGETVKDTATYKGMSEELKGRDSFEAIVMKLNVKGSAFENVSFRFPEGNEVDHAHEDGHDHGHDHKHHDELDSSNAHDEH